MKKIKLDKKQSVIKEKLDNLSICVETDQKSKFSFFKKTKIHPKSLYIFGDVGRGKSMLMKGFYNSVDCKKTYFHFNDFMENIHINLKDIRLEKNQYKDELAEATKRLVLNYEVLCLDEMQVNDIADAMLLSRIFEYIFSQKIIVIFTSNFAPHNLYPNGLQREKFIEFVELILLKNCEVLNLDSEIDYRKEFPLSNETRFFQQDEKESFYKLIDVLKEDKELKNKNLKVWGRKVVINRTFETDFRNIHKCFIPSSDIKIPSKKSKIALLDFEEIINSNLAASDFRVMASEFDLIFLINLSKFSPNDINEARRFVLFIDEIYEKKLALLVLSKVNIENIFDKYYLENANSRIFLRSRSRISEIKSDSYFLASKIF